MHWNNSGASDNLFVHERVNERMHIVCPGVEQVDEDVVILYEAHSSHGVREVVIRPGGVIHPNCGVYVELSQHFSPIKHH